MDNPYKPIPVELVDTYFETNDRQLKSFKFRILDEDVKKLFDYKPGQFAQLSVLGKGEAPFGIASSPTEGDELLFTINRIGSVTQALHELEAGDKIGIRGPLGNWYPVDKFEGSDIVIVGGGYAFTTLRSLYIYLRDPSRRSKFGKITIVYGAREPGLLLYRDDLEEWKNDENLELVLTIDNPAEGWTGKVGFVPPVLKETAPSSENAYAVVCGPPVMIKFTLPVLHELGFSKDKIYTSLEMRMKCGIGKCGRCNIGHKYICVDGPVFSMAELDELTADL
ncbi:FAD/NAD(P)-binding protein [bacterium]|nr:FAD/NAD(P)-binding protein [bacterium]